MPEPDYLKPYADATRDAGPSFEALLWHSPEAQRTRFDVAIDTCNLRGRVVADIGCGLADFAARLTERGIEYGRCIGVEGVPGLAQGARDRVARDQLEECVIIEGDFVADERLFATLTRDHGVEVLTFSGSLNTLKEQHAVAVLDRAWDAVAGVRGGQLVFNFLSSKTGRPPSDTGPANRFDPVALTAWALGRTPLVTLRHDYWQGHDATIRMAVSDARSV